MDYPIYTENGKLFCKCRKDKGADITLLGKKGSIPFEKFIAIVASCDKTPPRPKKQGTA